MNDITIIIHNKMSQVIKKEKEDMGRQNYTNLEASKAQTVLQLNLILIKTFDQSPNANSKSASYLSISTWNGNCAILRIWFVWIAFLGQLETNVSVLYNIGLLFTSLISFKSKFKSLGMLFLE